ncbi:MAG: hypothetical protein IKT34_01780 [Clostridia bacterium]|nr:hypothetical protein [Clostridia bacterium]
MGFGIALFGYACLLMSGVGGDLFAAILLAYGFFLASRLDNEFLHASISALFILPAGVLNLCEIFGLIKPEQAIYPYLNTVTFFLSLAAWFLMSYYWLSAVVRIANSNNAPKLSRAAKSRLVVTSVYILITVAVYILKMVDALGSYSAMAEVAIFIIRYAVIFYNIFFLHTCFILITSEKQYEKDKQQLAREQADALEKAQRERAEALERLNRRNKK